MLSRDNKLVKDALKLKQKKYRELEGLFLVEGIRFIEDAIINGAVKHLFYSSKIYETRGYERVLNSEVQSFEVSDDTLRELCDTENPQGAAAVVSKRLWSLDDIKNDFLVIADGIQDPGNLGTIIRTADAAGAGAVIVLKGTVDVFNSKTLRSTMGSIFHIPVIFYDEFEKMAHDLKHRGYRLYAASLNADGYIYDFDFRGKSAIIIGSEANGIPQEHFSYVDNKLKIPMAGDAESLNAAIAAAVIIYEIVRQRMR